MMMTDEWLGGVLVRALDLVAVIRLQVTLPATTLSRTESGQVIHSPVPLSLSSVIR